MSEWKECRLDDIADVRDGTHDSPKQKDEGEYLITSRHIKNGKLDFSSAYKISLDDYQDVNKRSKVHKWDVLFSMIGTVGEMTIVDFEPNFAIKNIGLFKTNGDKDLANWIYYYFKSDEAKAEINAALKGSTQQYITLSDLRNFPILLPTLPEQKAIAGVLSSFDDKIDLLHRQNKTLEAMAEALFRQWFVEEAGEDWEEMPLGDLLTITSSKRIFYSEYVTYGVPFYRSKEIIELRNKGSTTSELYISNERFNEINSKFGSPKEGDILMTSVGTLGVAYRVKPNDKFYFKDGNLTWFKDFNKLPSSILYLWLISKAGQEELSAITIGSTQQALTIEGLKSIVFKMPTRDIIEKCAKEFEVVISKIDANQTQIRTLEKLRDTLLPKLMSGEVRVGV